MVAQSFNLFHRVAGGTVADRLMAEFNTSATAFGALMALLFYVYGFMQFPAGALSDSLGPRKTITLGCLAASVGGVTFGMAPSLPLLFISRFLIGLGISVIFVSLIKLSAEWFSSRHFGFMSALTVLISSGGALAATTPLALLVTWTGWRASFVLIGLLNLGVCLACWLIIRNRPQEKGLPSISELEEREPVPPAKTPTVTPLSLGQRVRIVFANPYIWPPFLVGAALYGTLLVFTGAWGIPYLMQVYHLTRSDAANYTLLATLGIMAGSLFFALLSDRVMERRRLPAILCTSGYLALWLILTFWNAGRLSPATLATLSFFLGFFIGYQGLIFACAKEITPPAAVGMVIGVVNMGPFITPAILQPLFGRVLDLGWQGAMLEGARVYPVEAYHQAFLLICGVAAIGAVSAFFIKETRCRNLVR
jgi:sugar phosphate permease